jgi:hypothetical protein
LCRLTKATGRTTKYGHDTIKRAGSDTERGKQGKKKKKKKKENTSEIFFSEKKETFLLARQISTECFGDPTPRDNRVGSLRGRQVREPAGNR